MSGGPWRRACRALGDLLHLIEDRLLPAPERFCRRISGRFGFRVRGDGLDLRRVLLGFLLLVGPLAALVVGVRRGREELRVSGALGASAGARRPSPTASLTVARWTLRLRANASMDERRRC
jgi:hypothetical protein